MVNKRVQNAILGCNLKNNRMISVCFQGKPFNTTVIQVYAPTTNAEEVEVDQFYEDLQDLLELTPKKDSKNSSRDRNTRPPDLPLEKSGKAGLKLNIKILRSWYPVPSLNSK